MLERFGLAYPSFNLFVAQAELLSQSYGQRQRAKLVPSEQLAV